MACPTCSHTMSGLGHSVFHCPRCGTVRQSDAVYVPALVWRVREFRDQSNGGKGLAQSARDLWRSLGVEESLAPPGERKF